MISQISQKVYYSDTDAYGVVWHGAYLRWLEMGRMEFCEEFNCNLVKLANEEDITIPVANINISYKSPAKLYDELIISSEIVDFSKYSLVFKQIIKNKQTDKIFVTAEVTVVCVHNDGKLYRSLPKCIFDLCERAKNEA